MITQSLLLFSNPLLNFISFFLIISFFSIANYLSWAYLRFLSL